MDPSDLNYLSEVESLSDSDWLDISSRASEDNDSFADSDASDHEDLASDYRPPSRRSIESYASTGEIQGWEGVVADGVDDEPAQPSLLEAGSDDRPLLLSQQSLTLRTVALSEAAVAQHTALEDPEEEQRVKEALDQSMVSTLSASRSNSLNASVQTSVVQSRDLRLSFPDPLSSTSPQARSLSPSFEDISADMTHSSGKDTQPFTDLVTENESPFTAADQGSIVTPSVARDDADVHTEVPSSVVVDFSIVLYGASSAIKHRVIHRLLEKLMATTQCGFSSLPQIDVPQNIRALLSGERETTHYIISILDRTGNALMGKELGVFSPSHRPSLAIVFLPSLNLVVPEHTLYLPVLIQGEIDEDEDNITSVDRLLEAEYQWDTLKIPKSRLISSAFTVSKGTVVDEEEIERAPSAKVTRALRPLLPLVEQWTGRHLASRHAFTLFAILSIVLGYLVNGSLPLTATRRASPTIDIAARPAPTPVLNASLPAPTPTASPSSMALIPSSLKDFALAAIAPYAGASTSYVAMKAALSPTAVSVEDGSPSGAPSECACGCGLITWPEKFRPTTDVMLRPTPPTPALVNQAYNSKALAVVASPMSPKGKGKARAVDDSLYALSTRIAGALSEYLDMSTMFTQTRYDMQEILDALDELGRAINKHTETAWEQSKSTVEVVRSNIRSRHERARTRAKELRAVGERLLSTVNAQVRGRLTMAKDNARVLRDHVRVRREESFRVRSAMREARRERRAERRGERRMRRAQRVEV